MIIPLPPVLMDVLQAINLGISALLLMVAVYIKSPLAFVTFPAVLLLTTLFRLSLGIAATRMILL
ncbi:MAG: FHIPEP family type III secretion protein, partial [Mesorhizobium sp.]